MVRAAVVLSVLSCTAIAAADSPWKADGSSDGLWVERRDVPGSSYDEIRVSTARALSLQRVCDTIFAKGREVQSSVRFKKREVLRETDTERWTYEQIAVPWVTDRDYVMRTRLDMPASSGRCEVSFETETDPSRPPVQGFVRIPKIRGHWTVAPLPDGRLAIQYDVFSDPGGGIPAFLARGGQRNAAVDFVKVILAHAAAPVAPQTASIAGGGKAEWRP